MNMVRMKNVKKRFFYIYAIYDRVQYAPEKLYTDRALSRRNILEAIGFYC